MSDGDFEQRFKVLYENVQVIGKHFLLGHIKLDTRALASLNLSFSSSGEDLWLRQFMKARLRSGRPGFYVDLGANHPLVTSNTYLFYVYGWNGICIDANVIFKDEFTTFRPRDVLINAAVSDLGKSLYFAELQVAGGHKQGRVALDPKDFPRNYTPPMEVPARTLAAILREHVPPGTTIDFMTIDLEDSELPALRSNDWQAYKPRVILIECGTGFDPLDPYAFPTLAFLKSLGYVYRGYSSNNVLMATHDFDAVNALIG